MVLRHGSLVQPCSQLLKVWKHALTSKSNLNPRFRFQSSRYISTSTDVSPNYDIARIRNIGIIAHIDAGKTTTTERMLYLSGYTKRIGEVDEGSTVTDFLPAERARGITIQSAAVTFHWPPSPDKSVSVGPATSYAKVPHQINLIDTPGHADFTFEVRRSLRVLDGAICILDGVAGVEAQTEQVWKQAGEWRIPRIAYINKLDRDGAAFGRTVKEIGMKLESWPAVCQIPWWLSKDGDLHGIGDVINLQGLSYEKGGDGKKVKLLTLEALGQNDHVFALELKRARTALVELLSEHDDIMVEDFLEAHEDHLLITPEKVVASLRRCLLKKDCKIVPTFAGASFRNIGVQPLLNAVIDLLPSPQESFDPEININQNDSTLGQLLSSQSCGQPGSLAINDPNRNSAYNVTTAGKILKGCALAFKVVNDPRKGVLVYFRVYTGSINRNDLLYNTNLQVSERASTLLRVYASESIPVQTIEAGQIGVLAGSKFARTGDTLITYSTNKATPPAPLHTLQLRPIHVPPPVFFASIEPNSMREEKDLREKLSLLLREDPSLHVNQDEDTGQTLISGMGELHLEIARDRLVCDLKANATMGKITIGYRETFTGISGAITKIFDKEKGDAKGRAGCTAIIEPLVLQTTVGEDNDTISSHEQDGNIVVVKAPSFDQQGNSLDCSQISLPSHLSLPEIKKSLINGALAALSRGPSHFYPVYNVRVTLEIQPAKHIFGSETTYAAFTAAAKLATIAAFRDAVSQGYSALMEPVMDVDISVDDANLGNVIHDISSNRGGHVVSLGDNEETDAELDQKRTFMDVNKIYAPPDPFDFEIATTDVNQINIQRSIKAKVPLRDMIGYLKHLRSMTGGKGTFVMSVDRFAKVTGQREKVLISSLSGGL